MNAVRIECKNQSERCIDDRHHNLKFDSHAASDSRVCARKESHLFGSELTFAVEDLPSQLIFFENPRVSNVYEWRHGKHASDDWNAIFDVQQTLRIAADIDNVVHWARYRIARFRIDCGKVANDISDRSDLPEVKASNVEIASHEKSLIIGHSCAVEPVHV